MAQARGKIAPLLVLHVCVGKLCRVSCIQLLIVVGKM